MRDFMMNAAYNRDGSMTNTSAATIKYHAYHRMPVDVNGIKLRYNSRGMRISKGERSYRGYGDDMVESANGAELCYVSSPNGIIYTHSGGLSVPVLRNRQRSVCACGASLVHYAPYGEFAAYGDVLPRRMFTGYEYDEEWDMYNARKRLYSSALRVFVSVDPKFQYSSPYLYCMSDPFNSVDPTGEMSAKTIADIVVNAVLIVAEIVITIVTWGAGSEVFAANAQDIVNAEDVLNDTLLAREARLAGVETEIERREGELEADHMIRIMAKREEIFREREVDIAGKTKRLNNLKLARRNLHLRNFKKTAAAAGALAVGASGVKLGAEAAAGEHISASEAIDAMLIQPAISILGMGVGSGVGMGVIKAAVSLGTRDFVVETFNSIIKRFSSRLLSYTIGAAAGALTTGVVSSASHKEDLGSGKTWTNIGIGVGVAVGLAAITAGVSPLRRARRADASSDHGGVLSDRSGGDDDLGSAGGSGGGALDIAQASPPPEPAEKVVYGW
jgi:RHS repeat-associated protein